MEEGKNEGKGDWGEKLEWKEGEDGGCEGKKAGEEEGVGSQKEERRKS